MDPTVEKLIESKNLIGLASHLKGLPAPEIADLLTNFSDVHYAEIYQNLPFGKQVETFSHSDKEKQKTLAIELTDQEAATLLSNLCHEDRTRFLENLPSETRDKFLHLLSHENSTTSRQLLSFPIESVGRHMTPDFITVLPDWTIENGLSTYSYQRTGNRNGGHDLCHNGRWHTRRCT